MSVCVRVSASACVSAGVSGCVVCARARVRACVRGCAWVCVLGGGCLAHGEGQGSYCRRGADPDLSTMSVYCQFLRDYDIKVTDGQTSAC